MLQFRLITFVLFFYSFAHSAPLTTNSGNNVCSFDIDLQDPLAKANDLYNHKKHEEALKKYDSLLHIKEVEQAPVLKKIALCHAALDDAEKSTEYLEKYLLTEFNTSFIMSDGFRNIRTTKEYQTIKERYYPKISVWSILCLFVSFIGIYIAVMLNFNKSADSIARRLISFFVLIQSIYIFHICLHITNINFTLPHSYLMSSSLSFLFGPLLYFYFKRITQQYEFRKRDLFHLIPTFLILVYLIPIYLLPANKKLQLMLGTAHGYNSENSTVFTTVFILKIVSLSAYVIFMIKLYLKSKRQKKITKENRRWQINICTIHVLYIVFYALYGILALNNLTLTVFFTLQVVLMALMVLYIGYSANIQPDVFSGAYSYSYQIFPKYKNSGLTEGLSHELKEKLLSLFNEEKIYKESDISLELLAAKMNTTRHNASQVINEHFGMNFHELINKYRIQEAKSIIENDHQKNFNIIDVAYEVGYNNKVTFNKAFKKDTQLTPSEYQKINFKA